MNLYQRIILVLGALAVIIVILTAPQVQYGEHGVILEAAKGGANVIDIRTTSARLAGVLAVTALLWIALRGATPKVGVTGASILRGLTRFYLVLCALWLLALLAGLPLMAEHWRREALSEWERATKGNEKIVKFLKPEDLKYYWDLPSGGRNYFRQSLAEKSHADLSDLFREFETLPASTREVLMKGPPSAPGFADFYRDMAKHWLITLGLLVGFPAGLYALMWATVTITGWVACGFRS